jgi:hypothetical protein
MVGLVVDGYTTLVVVEHNVGIRHAHLETRVDQDDGVYTANGSTDLKPRRSASIATSENFKPIQIIQTLW